MKAVTIQIPDDVAMFLAGDPQHFVVAAVVKEIGKVSRDAARHIEDANPRGPVSTGALRHSYGGLAEREGASVLSS